MKVPYKDQYHDLWRRFASELSDFYERIGTAVATAQIDSLHGLLQDLHWVPYNVAKEIMAHPPTDADSRNVGAVTGLFFEQATVAIIVPYLRNRLSDAVFERNRCSHPQARNLARDPDLFVASGNRAAAFEVKVSPKKRDLEYVERLHAKYEDAGVSYYLVAGAVSAPPGVLEAWAHHDWACFMWASSRNQKPLARLPKLDELLERAAVGLAAA